MAAKAAKSIPKPDVVRAKLAENLREGRLLRKLLRLSELAQRDRLEAKGQGGSR
jgi:hypothetical protein